MRGLQKVHGNGLKRCLFWCRIFWNPCFLDVFKKFKRNMCYAKTIHGFQNVFAPKSVNSISHELFKVPVSVPQRICSKNLNRWLLIAAFLVSGVSHRWLEDDLLPLLNWWNSAFLNIRSFTCVCFKLGIIDICRNSNKIILKSGECLKVFLPL